MAETYREYSSHVTSNRQNTYISFFFFNDTATTEIYTLSLHDALPILDVAAVVGVAAHLGPVGDAVDAQAVADRKSTRLNSSHLVISYAVFCLKKKKKIKPDMLTFIRRLQSSLRNTWYTHTT